MALGWVKISMGWVKVWKAVYLYNISSSCGANYTRFRNWLVWQRHRPPGELRGTNKVSPIRSLAKSSGSKHFSGENHIFIWKKNCWLGRIMNSPTHPFIAILKREGENQERQASRSQLEWSQSWIKADGGNGDGVERGPVHRHLCRPPPHHRHHPLHPHQHLPGEQFNLTATLIGLFWQK